MDQIAVPLGKFLKLVATSGCISIKTLPLKRQQLTLTIQLAATKNTKLCSNTNQLRTLNQF
jgi:hypothetical protein